jgi:hypothetical protein
VLSACRGELGLPPEVRLEFCDLGPDRWGMFQTSEPLLIRLSDRHLQPEHYAHIPSTVGHESMHCKVRMAVMDGLLPIKFELDDDLNERVAQDYGARVAARWRGQV